MKTAAQIAGAFFGAAIIGAIGYVALSAGTVSTVAAAQSLSISNPGPINSLGYSAIALTADGGMTSIGQFNVEYPGAGYSPGTAGLLNTPFNGLQSALELYGTNGASITANVGVLFSCENYTTNACISAIPFSANAGLTVVGGETADVIDAGIIQAARYLDPPPSVLVNTTLPTTLPNTTLGLTALGAGFKPTIAAFAYVIKTAGVGTAVETIQVADTGGNICYIGVPCTQAIGNWTVTTGFDGTCTFNAGQAYQLQFGPVDAGTSCSTAPVFQSISASAQIVHN